ncbi:NAD-dependent epimerase/dehydratase family protein [Halosolutus halophilus]|uniref:NAD-dependent epimerase/dehydratase family protein n=1 Tax=Halosolutus halophilus TaxID=1552990 RepID=UPI0022350926|nr:NAD-dependent epimerase/dehydratase family protein [Halosolutus halophilus]
MEEPQLTDASVLITGGAGFIGSRLAHALVADNEVTILDDFSSGRPDRVPDAAAVVESDIRDRKAIAEAVRNVDVVFHQAALVSVAESVRDPLVSHRQNATGTLNLLEAAREQDARVVFASSAAIYGRPTRIPIAEDDPKTPTSPYGLEKLTADHYARLYNELYGLETIALRYFNVYGSGQQTNDYSGVISVFVERARNDDPLTIFGDGEQTRDFVHVDDVVQANLRAATTKQVGRAYNVGTGTRVTITELAESIVDVTDSDSELVYDDPREGDVRHSEADITKAQTELGYEPTVMLEAGLRSLAENTER